MIEKLITPPIWLMAKPETRAALAKEFGLKRSGSPVGTTVGGKYRVDSDGYTVDDLRRVNVHSMGKFLGEGATGDVFDLFQACVDKVEGRKSGEPAIKQAARKVK